MCLKDEYRTETLKKAIEQSVRPGNVVVDIGSGSGILSFFAAAAGAEKVYAVEIEHTLAEALRESIRANGFSDRIVVVEADIMSANLPADVDVVIGEIMETGLIDELQVPAVNNLRNQGVIGAGTVLLPSGYETYVDLVSTDNLYYGYKVFAPKHEWPFYSNEESGWYKSAIESVSERKLASHVDFTNYVDPQVTYSADLPISDKGKPITALRISGLISLGSDISLGATNALNGDKILPLFTEIEPGRDSVHVELNYEMGAGFKSLSYSCS
jgi:FkbM family methyltransferase